MKMKKRRWLKILALVVSIYLLLCFTWSAVVTLCPNESINRFFVEHRLGLLVVELKYSKVLGLDEYGHLYGEDQFGRFIGFGAYEETAVRAGDRVQSVFLYEPWSNWADTIWGRWDVAVWDRG
jgi:hypothetical protein